MGDRYYVKESVMATPTAPTVTLPPVPAAEAAPPAGPLASILQPVEPARPVKPIGSTASMAEEAIGAARGEKPAGQAERAATGVGKPEHPVGALVRAIAARIGRTGSTHNVKRQHTITESRVSGNSVNTTNANRASRDAKNHQVGQHRSNRDAKVADLNNKVRQQYGRDQRDVKSQRNKAATSAQRNSRDTKDHRLRDTKDSNANAARKDTAARTDRGSRTAKTSDAQSSSTKTPGGAAAKGGGSTTAKGGSKVDLAKKDTPAPKPAAGAKNPADKDAAAKTERSSEKPQAKAAVPDGRPRPRTQSSREAGYHDGARAAAVVGHVKAYRDGVQDGYADRTAANEAEKKRMDDAKAKNATKPGAPAAPQMAPASGSTVDLAKTAAAPASVKAEPAQVTGVGENTVSFDAGGTSHALSRGEVRTLKAFERRMAAKRPVMQKAAEDSKTARAKAAEHATRARRLAEQAKDVQGGASLVAKLQRLAEKAESLRTKTQEIEKAALRGAEAVTVLLANTNTRHGGIYKAVADSPLTKPAEREFYQDKEGS